MVLVQVHQICYKLRNIAVCGQHISSFVEQEVKFHWPKTKKCCQRKQHRKVKYTLEAIQRLNWVVCTYQESRGGFPLIIFLSLRVSLVVAVRSGRKAAKWKINWCLYLQSCKRGQCHNSLLLLPLATWISKIDYNKHRLGNPQKWKCQLFSLLGKKYVKLEVFLHIPVLSNIQAMRTYALRRSKIRVKHSLLNIAIYLEWVLPLQSLSIQRSRKTRLGLWDPICLLRPFLLYQFSNPFLCICLYLIYQ